MPCMSKHMIMAIHMVSGTCNEVYLIDLKLRDYSMKLCEPQAMKELNKGTH